MITNIKQLLKIYNVKTEEKLNWLHISAYRILSEEFIEKHSDKVFWYLISSHQKLSEPFIEKHSDKLDWNCISVHQQLSEEFIEKHSDKVNWKWIYIHQTLSKEFFRKYWKKISILSVVKNCGNKKRKIYRLKESPNLIRIGCFKGTKEEAIEAIKKKYKDNSVAMQHYIKKVELCFNTTLID